VIAPLLLTLAACRSPAPPCAATGEARVRPTPAPTNLLMISMDTLRRDRVGRYSGGSDTPFLDGLIAQGVALEDHRSCSNWTFASVMCALGGRNNLEMGFMPEAGRMDEDPLPTDTWTLGSWLGDRGWRTGLVTANFWMSADYGFDRFYRTLVADSAAPADRLTDLALENLDAVIGGGGPWYFHVHYIDPHVPYTPPEQYLGGLESLAEVSWDLSTREGVEAYSEARDGLPEEERALVEERLRVRYGGELRFMDDEIARLWEALEARGALADTLVVLFSDHGEQFWDHGQFEHGQSLYGEETRSVAAFLAPGLAPGSWEGPTSHADLLPTITEALGLGGPTEISGAPVGALEGECPRYAEHMDEGESSQSVEIGGLRLIYTWDGGLELYDLEVDPGEQDDLYAPGAADAEALWEALAPRVEAAGSLYPGAEPVLP
jgi:arylsulfatase A-like enzyme